MTEGTWDEEENELIRRWKVGEIDAKTLLEGFRKIDKQRLGYIR